MHSRFKFLAPVCLILVMLFSIGSRTSLAMSALAGQQAKADTAEQRLQGIWQGTLDVGAVKLRLVLKISKAPDGKYTGTVDSVDQGANDLPIDSISFKDGSLRFEMKAIGATYEGKMNNEGTEISGQWQQGPAPFPLVFKRTEKAAVLNRPQEPKRPFPYDEKEVAYENKRDKVKLAGTLTLPRTPGPFPAVLLITGSGPQDRDESLMGHKPFLVLSDYLTRAGVAVLRVDDRGVGGSSRGGPDDTSENYTEDVLAGVEFLKSQKEINPRQIGLVGHSEGGMIAPMAAARSKDIAFIVLMAGPGLPGDKLLMMQSDLLMRAQSEEAFARYNAWFANILAISKSETDQAAAEKKMRQEVDRRVAEIAETQKQELATFRSMMEAQSKIFLSPWFRYFLNYDPRPTLMQVKIPVLAINGERDLQVPPREDLAAIEEALRAGGNSDFQTVLMPNLNHLFQTSRTGAPAEYGQIEETIAPVALKTIADWILKHTSARASSARQD